MIRNYLISSWRNLMKHKRFSAINIFSLTIGIAACIVIYLFVRDETSFDSFHSKKENLYRLCEVQSFTGTNTQKVALSMPGMGPTLMADFPEVAAYTRYWGWDKQAVEVAGKSHIVGQMAGVDSTFLRLFDYELLAGDREGLRGPLDALISESTAKRIYGTSEVVGETFRLDNESITIRGVLADPPDNTHLQFDVLLSIQFAARDQEKFNSQFGSNYVNTYLLLNPGADLEHMATRFPEYLVKNTGWDDVNDSYKLFLQPLEQVHLNSTDIEHDYNNYRKFNGAYINVFILIGIFILVIASVNFMNLTTARAGNRAKEVGVRKTIGAARKQLFVQFILESTLMALLAFILALMLDLALLPFLNSLIGRNLSIADFIGAPSALLAGLLITISLGFLAGMYPAVYLSSFKPVLVLKGLRKGEKRSFFRSALVVLQFSLALSMIVCTLIVVQQLHYMKNKDIGFKKDHILLVDLNNEARENYQNIKQELVTKSNVLGVTASTQRIGNNFHQWGFKARVDTGMISFTPSNVMVDFDYLEVYGIRLKEGRSFSKEHSQDSRLAFIVNEALAKELGLDNPVGKRAGYDWYPDDSLGTIIGVAENFNFNSLHFKINTLSMSVNPDWGYSEMSVRLNGQNLREGIREVEAAYNKHVTDYPFEYTFLDDHFDQLYQSDSQLGVVITIIAVLSILIGCMGLFGLASIAIERRIKEIGIRKVMGASVKDLVILLSRKFGMLILISFVVATPFTWLYLSDWLESFAYRIAISPWVFFLGGLLAMVIAMLTISYHVFRAATSNPVDSLRYE